VAWNEPGGGKDKDPWGGGDQGPPDLDEAFRKLKQKLSGGGGGRGELPAFSANVFGIVLIVLVALWAFSGLYTVDEAERAVVLRFGRYIETVDQGLHWNPPLIDTVLKENITRVRSAKHRALMLTQDDNIVDVSLSVQYRVADPKAFLLEVRDPEISLAHATESALRHVIGSTELHQILTEGRAQVASDVRARLQRYVDLYHTGIAVDKVNIEDAQPPDEVQAAFDDVIRAKEDEERLKNEAESYKNGIIPEARGMAQRQIEEANAYKEQVIARAQGEAARFQSLLTQYERAPQVTRQRLYLDTMEAVLGSTSKVLVDTKGGSNNMMYLPLDKMMSQTPSPVPINEQTLRQLNERALPAGRDPRQENRQ
jgi:membrane protease subunit HflK